MGSIDDGPLSMMWVRIDVFGGVRRVHAKTPKTRDLTKHGDNLAAHLALMLTPFFMFQHCLSSFIVDALRFSILLLRRGNFSIL